MQPFQPQQTVTLVEEGKMALVNPVDNPPTPVMLPPDQPKGTNEEAVDPPQGKTLS